MYTRRKVYSIAQDENGEDKLFSTTDVEFDDMYDDLEEREFSRVSDFFKRHGIMKASAADKVRFAGEDASKKVAKQAKAVKKWVKKNPKIAAAIGIGTIGASALGAYGATKGFSDYDDENLYDERLFSDNDEEEKLFCDLVDTYYDNYGESYDEREFSNKVDDFLVKLGIKEDKSLSGKVKRAIKKVEDATKNASKKASSTVKKATKKASRSVTDTLKRHGIMKKSLADKARFAGEDAVNAVKKGAKKASRSVTDTLKRHGIMKKSLADRVRFAGKDAVKWAKKNPKLATGIGVGSALGAGALGAYEASK